eukprot:gene22945-29130_t
MWLQCLDSSETGDNSFQAGHVLTAKLYGPPELKSMQFDINAYSNPANDHESHLAVETAHPDLQTKHHTQALSDKTGKFNGGNGFSVPTFGGTDSPDIAARKRFETEDSESFSPLMHGLKENRASPGLDEDASYDGSSVDQTASFNSTFSSNIGEAMMNSPHKAESKGIYAEKKNTTNAHAKGGKREGNIAKICGEVAMTRIIGLMKGEAPFVYESAMSDEKATRYNSKQSIHLGRWAIHTALRNDGRTTAGHVADGVDQAHTGTHRHHGHGPTHLAQPKGKHVTLKSQAAPDNYVYSMSPIVIQQDLYCIGAAHPNEFHKWPMTSHSVIRHSESITGDEKTMLNDFYEKNGGAGKGGHKLLNPNAAATAAVSNAFNLETKTGAAKGTTAALPPGTANTTASGATAADHENEIAEQNEHVDFGCLRKIVNRGFPYDYSVDRKCVWKFCLFEQFSDNNMVLSEKEKSAKKVMETASMALKLSQMNRAGGRTHIATHQHRHAHLELPALVGGETFSRNLREIVFRNQQTGDNEHLLERRNNEQQLNQYFRDKINAVVAKEEDIMKHGLHRAVSSISLKTGGSVVASVAGSQSNSQSNSHNGSAYNLLADGKGQNVSFSVNELSVSIQDPNGNNSNGNDNDDSTVNSGLVSLNSGSVYNTNGGSYSNTSSPKYAGASQYEQYNAQLQSQYGAGRGGAHSSGMPSPVLPPAYVPSKEILAVFTSNAQRIQPKQLLLNHTEALQNYDKLSEGEKVLALHKTFSSIKHSAEAVANKRKMPTRTKITPSIQQKLDKLVQGDADIAHVLSYKDRIESMKRAGVQEDESY